MSNVSTRAGERDANTGDASTRFRILGPLEVRSGEAWTAIGAPKWRMLLAVLLLNHGQVVSTERLTDELWGEEPPAKPANLVATYVHRLRGLIGDPDGRVLVTRSPGYRVVVDGDELDAVRFTRLVAAGRSALADGAAARAVELLGEALGLFRGPPLADVPFSDLVATEANRMEESRVAALGLRLEAEIENGDAAGTVAELRRLATDHPLREELWALLMRALCAAGRQAEALAAYEHARTAIGDELGVDPGPGLRQLHQEILAADARPAPRPAKPVKPALSQLPADVPDFTGRADQVEYLCRLFSGVQEDGNGTGAVVVSLIAGAGGLGKTTLAVHVAHQLRERFPDGQLYIDLRGASDAPAAPTDVLARFLRQLGVNGDQVPAGEDERAGLYRTRLAGRRMLIVLDDARDAAQARPLVPGSVSCGVLVTSRNLMPDLVGGRLVDLDVLDPAEARALLAKIVGAGRLDAEPDATSSLLAACAGLPLAIRITGVRLAGRAGWTIASLAGKVADERRRIDEFAAGDLAVRACFQVSFDSLPAASPGRAGGAGRAGRAGGAGRPDPARTFRLLGLWRGPFISLPAAASLLGEPEDLVADSLEMLVDAHLLQSLATDRYRLHDLLRVYAAEKAEAQEAEQDRDAAVRRILTWYLHTAEAAGRVISPRHARVPLDEVPLVRPALAFTSLEQALDWCESARANLVAAASQAASGGLHEIAWKLPAAMMSFFYRRGHWADWVATHEGGLNSARVLGDRMAEAWMLNNLGMAFGLQRKEQAIGCFTDALAIYQEIGDQPGQARAANNVAQACLRMRRFPRALEAAQRSLTVQRRAGDRYGEGIALGNLGDACRALARFDEAIGHLEQALDIFRELGDQHSQADSLSDLGDAYLAVGRLGDAQDCLRASLAIWRAEGERYGQAATLGRLGVAQKHAGQLAEARELLSEAHFILAELGDLGQAAEIEAELAELTVAAPLPFTDGAELAGHLTRLRRLTRLGDGTFLLMQDAGRHDLVFPGDGEMARRMRAYPWAGSAIGDPRDWPPVLRAACRICLTSRFPMIVWWGTELRFLYNDDYLPLLGDKHPALGRPGREVWSEIWDTIGPMLDSVMSTGQATWSQDLLLPMRRHGYWEETYWTYSYSPLHDEDGTVRGVFTAVTESTEQVVGRRRLAVLQDLGALAGRGRDVAEVCRLVVQTLSRAPQVVPYAAVYLRAADGEGDIAAGPAVLAASSAPGPVPAWPAAEVLRTGQPATLRDVAARFGRLPSGAWPDPPSEAMVLPLHSDAVGLVPVGAIVLAASSGRALDAVYQDFLHLVARQTAALVNGAVSYQAQLRRADELAALDRAKTTFFSNISHEFRTPLTLIMGPVEELRGRLGQADEVTRAELDVIHRNGLRLGKLVNSLLDFSRIEAGRMQARYEPVDLSVFTAELASVFRSAIERAGLRYEVDCPALSAPVDVDREMWEKILLNLLSNALKFTFEGQVTVTLGEKDGQAVLRVADTGSGIPAAELPRLFDRFYRVQNVRARSNEGSGIGLALVRELVGLHRGTISVESTEREGTAFTVRLPFTHPAGGHTAVPPGTAVPAGDSAVPLSVDPYVQEAMRWLPPQGGDRPDSPDSLDSANSAPPASALTRPPAAAGAGALRVLIADDNADMRGYLQRLLAPGYQVTTVTDGRAALAAARTGPLDLVISDVMMPGLDGLGLVAELRADPRTADLPVLLLSARAGEEAAIEGLDAGADDYLVKPFSAAELLARVRTSVQLSRMRGQHARWRSALVESLHEAFFLCGPDGAVREVNSAFTEMLGYGRDGLPYRVPHPWWPDPKADPDGYRMAEQRNRDSNEQPGGNFTVPVTHRDGRRLWVAGSFAEVTDQDNGRLVVGTFRDVTAEHYAIQRETALAALGQVLARAASMPEALGEALGELHRLWRARRVVAAIWTDAAEPAVTASVPGAGWPGLPEEVRAALSALRERPPLTPDVRAGGAGAALEHPSGTLAIWIELDGDRTLTAEDQTLLSLLCGRLGQVLHRAHLIDEQRATALALQRAILGPVRLPSGFSARYEPATRPLEVGGDWHDVVELPDGRIAIVVGDCVGHDLGAATVMGQLRSACRALLLQDAGPGQVLAAMDRFAASVPGAECTTVLCAVLDLVSGELTYSAAGHPPAIVAHPDGAVELLDGARSFPLAAVQRAAMLPVDRREASYRLPPRSTLLLYTDGLVERRGRSLTDGIAEAGAVIARGGEDPLEDLATQLMARLAPPGGYGDDVAVVLYRHPAPLELAFPADIGQLRPVRARLRGWLAGCGLAAPVAQDVLVAAGEAVANAIEHGHRDHPGAEIRLLAAVSAGRLRLTVADSGRWRQQEPEPAPYRGKGISLMRTMMDNVNIDAGPAGTTVTMDVRLTRDHSA